jgi:hypothetical protein
MGFFVCIVFYILQLKVPYALNEQGKVGMVV